MSAPMRPNLTAHGGRCYLLIVGAPAIRCSDRTLDETATKHTRLPLAQIVKHASLSGRYAVLAVDQLDFAALGTMPQPGRLRRAGRTHLYEDLAAIIGKGFAQQLVPNPVDVAQHNTTCPQCLARADHHTPALRIETHHIERRTNRDTQAAPLTHCEMNNAGVLAENLSVQIDDLAGFRRTRVQTFDDVGIVAGRYEANILAVMLVRNRQAETTGKLTGFRLGSLTEWKAQNVQLRTRGAEQEVALVTLLVPCAIKCAPAAWQRP